MDRTMLLRRVALVFGTLCAIMAGWYYVAAPKTLRIAVGPADSSQYRFAQAMARALKETQKPFRLEIVNVPDVVQGSRLLDGKKVDLAILRSDDATSVEARSLAILQKRTVLIVARADRGIEQVSDLAGKSLAIVASSTDRNLPMIERIFGHYDIAKSVTIDELMLKDLTESKAAYDAFILVADPTSGTLRTIVETIAAREGAELSFIGLPAPEGLATRLREFQKSDVAEGLFGGSPPKPIKELETVALTYELTASAHLSLADGALMLKTLIDLRTRLRRLAPRTSFDIEAPSVETPRRFLPHSGAASYVNDDTPETFLETYSDQIWLGLFLLSIVGSSVTGFLAWAGVFENPAASGRLHARINALAQQLAAEGDDIDLDRCQREADAIAMDYLRCYGRGPPDSETDLSLALWTSSITGIIERRQRRKTTA